eukprot:PLAT152.1.p1 GENE.PLAT152.1~~PLAT152.1.p1  ORF type:complete len:449 (-),score=134.44 PLAT152.1:1286-2449(-)
MAALPAAQGDAGAPAEATIARDGVSAAPGGGSDVVSSQLRVTVGEGQPGDKSAPDSASATSGLAQTAPVLTAAPPAKSVLRGMRPVDRAAARNSSSAAGDAAEPQGTFGEERGADSQQPLTPKGGKRSSVALRGTLAADSSDARATLRQDESLLPAPGSSMPLAHKLLFLAVAAFISYASAIMWRAFKKTKRDLKKKNEPPVVMELSSLKSKRYQPRLHLSGSSSTISDEQVSAVVAALPRDCAIRDWRCIFSTDVHGYNLATMLRNARAAGPALLVVADSRGYVFAAFASEGCRKSERCLGSGTSFVMSLAPVVAAYSWSGANDQFYHITDDAISFGGPKPALWLDGMFERGCSFACDTYSSPSLASSEEFHCISVQLWAFALSAI